MRSTAWGIAALVAIVPSFPHRGADDRRVRRNARVASVAPKRPATTPATSVPAPAPVAAPPSPRTETPARQRGLCAAEARADLDGRFLARDDLTSPGVDVSAIEARVTRGAANALGPDDAPADLVDVFTGEPASVERCEPPGGQCLRRDAATALQSLFSAMRAAGHEPWVHSAFRAYEAQCGVFQRWAHESRGGFCAATEQSALAGHSQHQLGTALDLFTREWAAQGPVFRSGFACSPGGRWLADHAWEHGFVMSYPLPPEFRSHVDPCWERTDVEMTVDPRTGYRYEPWHYRWIGGERAAQFHADWLASGPGSGSEITLDQWLRRRAGVAGDADLPTCDGCACGACTTRSMDGGPCGDQALVVDASGQFVRASGTPVVVEVRLARPHDAGTALQLDLLIDVPLHTVTQTPAMALTGPRYGRGTDINALSFVARGPMRGYADLPGAIRIAAEPTTSLTGTWPYRSALADPMDVGGWNGADVYLPARSGEHWFRMTLELDGSVHALRVALVRDGRALADPIEIDVPAGQRAGGVAGAGASL